MFDFQGWASWLASRAPWAFTWPSPLCLSLLCLPQAWIPHPTPRLSWSLGLSPRQPWIRVCVQFPALLLLPLSECVSVPPTTGWLLLVLFFFLCFSLPCYLCCPPPSCPLLSLAKNSSCSHLGTTFQGLLPPPALTFPLAVGPHLLTSSLSLVDVSDT